MKKLLNTLSQKWPEYLLEVLVLVIGIYAAFALDDWNEKRNLREQNRKVYGFIKDDLLSDIAEIDSAMIDYKKSLTCMMKMMRDSVSIEDYISDPYYIKSIYGYEDLIIEQRGMMLLTNSVDLNDKESTLLSNKVSHFYSEHIVEIEMAIDELSDIFTNNYNYWSQQDWFLDMTLGESVGASFYTNTHNNMKFKKQVGAYYVLYKIYIHELQRFQEDGQKMVDEIDHYLNSQK